MTWNKAQSRLLLLLLSGLLAAVAVPVAAEDDVIRLFFTANERKQMDLLRQRSMNKDISIFIEEEQIIPPRVRVNGLIIKQNGENVLWLNEQRNPQKSSLYGLDIDIQNLQEQNGADIAIPVYIHSLERAVRLKPGQHMDTSTGEIQEHYAQELHDNIEATAESTPQRLE
ncbi:hypothetical protein QUF61_03215 [Candidatus Venteria ishoeyi]|uniref:hypothetical protein n=1 Tax=Candidatus Venteria ishoeyi TaxID=1899563 RepID=UPI0025A5B7AC|nr:hypothetical protein [Candidatus Venteria ishoeyi]MDM8545483.1 hypothetical protein [Candidatus Venteria ishoeyi]